MKIRDKLNSIEGYQEIINRYSDYITDREEEIKKIDESSNKGIQLHNLPNEEVKKNTYNTLSMYKLNRLITMFSMGMAMEEIKGEYTRIINNVWDRSAHYIDTLWMLSIGVMLDVGPHEINKLVDMVKKSKYKDLLFDFLIHSFIPDCEMNTVDFQFKPYLYTQEIISFAKTDKRKSLERLKKYVTKEWYRGHSSAGWYNTHKSKWNIHSGYWSFESGALVKILGLDDSSLKDTQYYPYDMVHWR